MNKNGWDPEQYLKFDAERKQPYLDLVKLIHKKPGMQVLDLGCGTGEITAMLHKELQASYTLGIDSSPSMLAQSKPYKNENIEFQERHIESFESNQKFDLIFSNAALQWVQMPNHKLLFERITYQLNEEGQLAIQMPANQDYPTHVIAKKLAEKDPYKNYLKDRQVPWIETMEIYSIYLNELGFKKQIVRQQIYPHCLENTKSIIEWVKGSLLAYYRNNLPKELYEKFLSEYQELIIDYFGELSPFFIPFKRLLIWAEK